MQTDLEYIEKTDDFAMIDRGQEVELTVQTIFEVLIKFGKVNLLERHLLALGSVFGLPNRRLRPFSDFGLQYVVPDCD